MAAFLVKATLESILSKCLASGFIVHAQIGEPKSPTTPTAQSKRLTAAVMLRDARVGVTTLATSIEVHTVIIRLYGDAIAEDLKETELLLSDAVSSLTTDIQEDFDLNSTVESVDVAGRYGEGISTAWGHIELSGVMYRTADIIIPVIVNDVATHAA